MNFRETLKHGTLVSTKRELMLYKKHDTYATTVFPTDTPLMIWGFERFTDDVDPETDVEIEFLHGADLWCLAIPKNDFVANYLCFPDGNTKEEA